MFINDKTLGFIGYVVYYTLLIGRPIFLRVNLPQTEQNRSVYSYAEVSHTNHDAEVSGQFGTSAEVSGHFGTSAKLSGHFGTIN